MLYRLLDDTGGLRTFVVVFDHGDEAMEGLRAMAESEALSGAAVTGLGAFERAIVTYWDWDTKDYQRIPVDEQTARP